MKLSSYQRIRESEKEQKRIKSLLALIPSSGETVLDVGARDGFFSNALAKYFSKVTALDLEKPEISNEHIECVEGDVTNLQF